MMQWLTRTAILSFTCACCHVYAAPRLLITAAHTLGEARNAETIAIPWASVQAALPGALLQHLVVRNQQGQSIAYQVTNERPLARDPDQRGASYGSLLFQHDFAAGEQKSSFTVERAEQVSTPPATRAYARYVPERLDDFAWENDLIGHRTYGQALAAPASVGSDKEVLVTSGMDVWFKRVSYPVIDRWYNKGHEHYHTDQGEGLDMYSVGRSRGAGGVGIWDGQALAVSRNYRDWKILANGPIRSVFELSYDSWDAAGLAVRETKRITVDAGHRFDRIESTFVFDGKASLNAAVGLNKTPAYPERQPQIAYLCLPQHGVLAQWVSQQRDGNFGVAVILPEAKQPQYAEDGLNALILQRVTSGQPLRYYAGAVWSEASGINSLRQWQSEIEAEARRLQAPLTITTTVLP